jgi:hypothetical protein
MIRQTRAIQLMQEEYVAEIDFGGIQTLEAELALKRVTRGGMLNGGELLATRLAAISSLLQRGNPSLSSSKHRFQASIFHLRAVRRLQAKKASSEHVRTNPRSSIRAIQRIAAVSRPAHAEPLPQRAYDAISPHI